jgi:hypothetical protein
MKKQFIPLLLLAPLVALHVADGFLVRVIAYYGFPVGRKNLPALLHIHGGGQNANLQ